MLLGSRLVTCAYDLLPVLPRGPNDDAALALEAAGPLVLLAPLGAVTALSIAALPNRATDAALFAGRHSCCPPLLARSNASCSKSYINEAYYNLDKVFA